MVAAGVVERVAHPGHLDDEFWELQGQLPNRLTYEREAQLNVLAHPDAVAAVERLKEFAPKSIKFVCLLTCPEGIRAFHASHPDVPIYTAAIDEYLNDHGYIVPGLGDAGDRLYGTK